MKFDYELFEKCIIAMLEDRCYDSDFQIGVDLSDTPGVKIIFDGFGETDDGYEDRNSESYAVFIHRDSATRDFEFPEHETAWGMIVHRPGEEMCIYAWRNVEEETWDVIPRDDSEYDPRFTEEQFMDVVKALYDRWYAYREEEEEE